MRRLVVAVAALATMLGSVACQGEATSGTSSGSANGMIAQLNLGDFGGGNAPQANYNPYSPTALTTGFIFEPLFVMNTYNCEPTPWLGTTYNWESPTKLVVETRDGVKWTDGKPFSANDVAFTFNMMKAEPALDINGLWSVLSSVTAESDNQVVFEFAQPSVPTFTQIATTVIVPEHIWSEQSDPTKFTNPEAIGTGPFEVTSMNGQQLVMDRNPEYWQADKVQVQRLMYKKATGGAEVDKLRLARGEYDWNAMFIPDVEKTYVAEDPEHNHYWFPPGAAISIYMNLTKAPFDDVKFREAIAYAIDREEIAEKAQYGYVETASQTGLVLPGQADLLDPDIENQGKIPYDPQQAKQILADAGYETNGSGQLLGKDGKPMAFSFKTPVGWVDWIQAAQIIQRNLKDLGIEIEVQTPAPDIVDTDRAAGNFDMSFGVHGGGCNLLQAYQHPLASSQTAPIGEPAATNFVRWKDAETDELLDQLARAEDPADQKEILGELQHIMVEQFPVVPLWYGAVWFQYRTENAVGWPSEEDPYAYPTDGLLIMTHLRPATE